ncbi:unnamed protein product [Toxocara canis]|uniref:Anoctamin n=1 Tax=Toxocara canis TaxID=6265 RepID=A0A183UWR5_TOXCA|nr:unnamed protein product [Toxocara canis]
MIGFGEAAIAFYVPVFISFMVFNTMTGGVACILALAAYFLWTKQVNEYWKSQGVPGPTPNFFFGNFLQMQKGFHLYDIENARKYGPIYGGSVLGFRELNVCDVEMIKRIFIQEFPAFPERVVGSLFFIFVALQILPLTLLFCQKFHTAILVQHPPCKKNEKGEGNSVH